MPCIDVGQIHSLDAFPNGEKFLLDFSLFKSLYRHGVLIFSLAIIGDLR